MPDMLITDDRNIVRAAKRITFQILDPKAGDKNITWDKNDPAEIEDAQASFDYWTKEKKMKAYNVDKDGKRLGEMKKFDPDAERILIVPMAALVGG